MTPNTLNRAVTAHTRAALGGYTAGLTFYEALTLHVANGIVYSRPDALILARGVSSTADAADIGNPAVTFPDSRQDAWFIYLACLRPGTSLTQAIAFFPHIKPVIAYARQGVLKFAPATSFLRHIRARYPEPNLPRPKPCQPEPSAP
jgi:hypothetical protein